jgi:aldehyde dehydrogenase (NAD+)
VCEGTEKDVDIAVAAARKAFEEWRKVSPEERSTLLFKLADLMEKNLERLAAIETLDNGKSYEMATLDVTYAARCIR